MSSDKQSYRQIMKATSIFGGVQAINIIISIVRSKFIAVLLGPSGMGIAGLLTATTGMISALTNFGLGTSAVKDVAAAHGEGDETKIARVVTVFRRLVWITGVLGTVITIILSPWLSRLTFGNSDYTYAYVWISITLLFNQLISGQMVILQGLRKLQYLAKANVIGSFLGLILTLPLYCLWGLKAIVPVIILSSLVSLLISLFFANKIKIKSVKMTPSLTLSEGKNMLTMGFMISLYGLLALGTSYIIRIFISKYGGIEQVGLYNAGFTIITTYVSLIFSAMATDYFPRLSSVAYSIELRNQTINQQAEIAFLILSPIILIFLVFIKWVVILLYSNQFVGVVDMIHWTAMGMLFKSTAWAISFIFLAKGASKLFFWSELSAILYMLLFNIIGYKMGGLTGIGFSFMVGYIVYLFQVYIITSLIYRFVFDRSFIQIFIVQFTLAIICFALVKTVGKPYSYFMGSLIIVISSLHAYFELDKRIALTEFLKDRSKKVFKRIK